MPEVFIDGVSDSKNLVAKRRRKLMLQQLSSTAASCTKCMVATFTRNINDHCLTRVNQTKVKMKGLDTGNKNPKVDA